jgi:NTE family protein
MQRTCLVVIVLLAVAVGGNAQQSQYKNLVLEGGGVKGFAYAGAFQVLDSLGILQHIERVGGSSVGAIQATLLAIGYTPAEMMKIAANIPLKKFNDGFFPGGLSRMNRKYGFFKGQRITKWIEQLIANKTGDAEITFLQLHALKDQKNYRDLYITGTDLTSRCLRIFSYETYPNMKVKDALRISFSIPLYFEPLMIDGAGKVYKENKDNQYHMMVDGGLVSNYPVHMFDDVKYKNADGSNFSANGQNTETLGLLLERPEYMGYTSDKSGYALPINSLSDYLTALYQTVVDRPNPDKISLHRTINISHFGISGRVRKLPASLIQRLVESGRQGVRDFFVAK